MTVSKITEVTVFESPDGGRTVYARRPGQTVRELYSQDPLLQKELDDIEHQRRWMEIFGARDTNPGLDQLCEQVEILYELSKNHE
jgi:hypothetical protein